MERRKKSRLAAAAELVRLRLLRTQTQRSRYSGCAKCNELEQATREALAELGMDTAIAHVTDFAQIAAYGVMTTPALVVDGKVVSYGKVLSKDQVKALIEQARGAK